MNLFQNGLIVYGAGNTGRLLCDILTNQGLQIIAFVDRKAKGEYKGISIFSPEEIFPKLLAFPVLIGVHNRDTSILSIKESLLKWGWKDSLIYSLADFYRIAKLENIILPDLYWLGQNTTQQQLSRAERARDLFHDKKSRDLFDAQMHLRLSGEYLPILESFDQNQYRTEFLSGINQLDFVDAGCFDGDTIDDFVTNNISFRSIYAFEPDIQNIMALKRRIQLMELNFPITIFPLGLNDKYETFHFKATGEENSAITEMGNIIIQTMALDEILINQPVSYIKMDIEGAELRALLGCKNIIQNQHPILAVCVYHCPEHLWEIPLLINEYNPQYQLYLRLYGLNCFETVCYAVEKNSLARLKR